MEVREEAERLRTQLVAFFSILLEGPMHLVQVHGRGKSSQRNLSVAPELERFPETKIVDDMCHQDLIGIGIFADSSSKVHRGADRYRSRALQRSNQSHP